MTCFIHKLPASHLPWAYAIEFDFNAAMVEGVKTRIASRARCWKPQYRQWWFKADVIEDVCALAMLFCGRYVHVEQLEDDAPVEAYAALHLLPSAPPELVKVVYKTLAKLEHPDKGGDKTRMQAINSAYGILSHSDR